MENWVTEVKLLVQSQFASWQKNVETSVLCTMERVGFMGGLGPWPSRGRHLVLLLPVQTLFGKEIWSIKSSWCTTAGTLVLDIHGLRTAGHNQSHPVWCLDQKHSPTGIFLEHFTISRLTTSFTVTCGIKTVR